MSYLLRRIPTLSYTIQNILISSSTTISSVSSLFLTATVILPLSIIRAFLPSQAKAEAIAIQQGSDTRVQRKVVLIVGASRGIGYHVVREYAKEEGTTIIAVSKSMEKLETMASDIGPIRANMRLEALDISVPPSKIMRTISEWDRRYGPITHVYAVGAISNHLDDEKPYDLDVAVEMVNVNIVGNISVIMACYECMKPRRYGTICVVGSVAGLFNPANMITYSSTKAFINTFASSLRILALKHNIEVVTVAPGFIDTRMTAKMRAQGSTVPEFEFASAAGMAKKMIRGVECGGVGVIAWPVRQAVMMYALRAVNPICEDLGRYISYVAGLAGKKVT